MRPKTRSHTRFVLLLLTLVLALALPALAACGAEESTGEAESAPQSAFVGVWVPVDAMFDITWNEEDGRSYSLSSGGEGGSIEVAQDGAAITVTLVGKSGERSDPLPAEDEGDTLVFGIPISEDMPTETTLASTGEGLAELKFDQGDIAWEFKKTDAGAAGD